jgi:PAS domain S-box-containing protein
MRVLIVEDNDHDRLLLKYILEENGFEVVEAEDGIDGFEKASRHKPDMIISDANMPRMDGFQFLRKIKQDDALKSIPFVFYSAVYTGYREAELAISLGAEAFIIKPKEAAEFLDELKIIMEESGKKRPVTAELIEKDEEYLRQYSEIVVTKLEEKIRELENALSEIRQKEESLRESEARLQSIFRAAPVGIGLVSERRILLQVNERLCQMTGFSDEELVGMNSRILYPSDEDFEYVGNEKYAQIRDKGTGTVETRWKRKDGSIIYIILSSSPIDPEDLSRGVTFTALDITERKHSEEALKNKEKELKKRVRELEDFYSMAVGRELRMRELKDNIRENQEEIESLKKRLGKYEKID